MQAKMAYALLLLPLSAAAELEDPLHQECRARLEAMVRASGYSSALPGDFFSWLGETRRLREDATLAIATVGLKVASNLQRLRAHDERQVERYPALAVAFAAAWSKGVDAAPRRFWVDDWLVRGRDVPTMLESFDDFVERRTELRVPLESAPWQVLAHLADSVVPIEEREWAVGRYRKRKTEGLRHLFGAVPYTLDPERGDAPCTLESFLEYGGACTHNVQFAGGVFDAFGIPSGWAGGPGHTYPYWFEMDGNAVSVHRTNELGNRNGKIRDPLSEGHVWEDRLRLLVESLNHSRAGHSRASLAAWCYSIADENERPAAAAALAEAIEENPYCRPALTELAEATRARVLSLDAAGQAWKSVAKALGDRPHDLPPLLDRALPGPGEDSPTFAGDDALLKALARGWARTGDKRLAAQAAIWRSRALAARGKHQQAARLARDAAIECAATDAARFREAIDVLAAGDPGGPDADERLEFLIKLATKLDRPSPAAWSDLHGSRRYLTKAIVRELKALGRTDDAAITWYTELELCRGGGQGEEFVLIGGDGGAAFLMAPPGSELVGLRVATTGWNGRSVIGSVEALFARDGKEVAMERAGQPRAKEVLLRAPKGWYVAGMIAAGSDRLDGLQLVYAPLNERDSRVRMSDWVGSHGEREQLVGGRGLRITGVRGRAGSDVDALGLMSEPR